MTSARWLGVAMIASAITACGKDVLIEDGSGGAGGSESTATTSASGPSVSSTITSAAATSGGDGGDDTSVVVVGQGGAGAGSGEGGLGEGGAIDPYVPPEGAYEACEGYWSPMVDLLLECWGATAEYFYGAPDTVERYADNCAQLAFRGGLTVEAQQACNADIEAISSCDELYAYFNRGTDACTATLYGDLEVGEPCITPYECSTSACYVAPGATCGTCRPAAGEGEACDDVETLCGPYLDCVHGACEHRRPLGEECDDDTELCESGLACVGGECGEPIAEGDPCDANALTYECAQGTYCGFVSETCEAMTAEGLGGECGILDDGRLGLCADGLRCHIDDAQYHGTCIAPAADGDACSPNAPILLTNECESPATCFGGECAMRADALSCF